MSRSDTGYRVCLLGASLEGGNRGVCALGFSTLKLIFEARPDADIHLYTLAQTVANGAERRGAVFPKNLEDFELDIGGMQAGRARHERSSFLRVLLIR